MRIISGKYGGRRITPPANMPHTRPTTDIAKEGLFIRTQKGLPPGILVEVELYLPSGEILKMQGVVKRTIKTPYQQIKNWYQKWSKSLLFKLIYKIPVEILGF